ncbi:MAG: DUF883 family protein [Chloroflexota bacterium]
MSEVTIEKLWGDLKMLLDDVEELIKATAGLAGEHIVERRQRLVERLEKGKAALAQRETELRERAAQTGSCAINFLRDEGWCCLAVAACLTAIALCCQKHTSARQERPDDAPSGAHDEPRQ